MDKSSVNVTIPIEVKAKLESLAQERDKATKNRVYASDIVREALQEYFDKRGIELSVTVDRGGYRKG